MHHMQLKNKMEFPVILFIIFLSSHALLSATQSSNSNNSKNISVGVVLDLVSVGGRIGLSYLSMGLTDFYTLHKNYTTKLVLHVEDSKGLVIDSAASALKLLKDTRVDAIIGPQTSTQASFVMDLGDRAHVPIISFSATSPFLLGRTPYFIQTAQDDGNQVGPITAIFKTFQWRKATVIVEDSDYGHGMMLYLANALQDVDVRVSYRSIIPVQATDDLILKELYKMMTMQTRVFFVQMSHSLAARLFLRAREAEMMSKGYVWIVSSGIMDMLSSMDSHVVESMQGVLGVKPLIPQSENLVSFSRRWKRNFFQRDPSREPEISILGLWAYDTIWALAMAAERVGSRDSNASDNGITTINSTDLFNLEISQTGHKLLQEMLRTRFQGLSGDQFCLVNGRVAPSSFQILNLVGKGEPIEVGIWTQSVGLLRELKRNNITWPGESTDVPRGWDIQVRGKKLQIGVPVIDGFTGFVKVERDIQTNSTKVSGRYTDLFDSVIKALPYSVQYEYVPFVIGIDGSYDDLVYSVYLQKFDGAVGDITITANRSLYVDFTMPIAEGGVSMVVPIIYEDINDKWAFFKPLTRDLWLTSIAFFILTGFAVWVLEHRINTAFRGPPSQHVGMICWFPFSTLVFAHREKILNNFSKLVVLVWIFVVLILGSTYTASLSSRLTVQSLQPSYTGVEELIKNRNSVGYQQGSFVAVMLEGLGLEHAQLKPYKYADECSIDLTKGSKNAGISAYFDVTPHTKLFLSKNCDKYMTVGPAFQTDGFAFVFQRGSPLVADVSRAIISTTEGKKTSETNPECADSQSSSTSSSNSVGLKSFEGLFAITGSVTLTCLVAYLIVYLYKNKDDVQRIIATNPSSTTSTWSRICAVCRHFDQRDVSSYPFSRNTSRDTQDKIFPEPDNNDNNNNIGAAATTQFQSADSLTSNSSNIEIVVIPFPEAEAEKKDTNHEIIQPNSHNDDINVV